MTFLHNRVLFYILVFLFQLFNITVLLFKMYVSIKLSDITAVFITSNCLIDLKCFFMNLLKDCLSLLLFFPFLCSVRSLS